MGAGMALAGPGPCANGGAEHAGGPNDHGGSKIVEEPADQAHGNHEKHSRERPAGERLRRLRQRVSQRIRPLLHSGSIASRRRTAGDCFVTRPIRRRAGGVTDTQLVSPGMTTRIAA